MRNCSFIAIMVNRKGRYLGKDPYMCFWTIDFSYRILLTSKWRWLSEIGWQLQNNSIKYSLERIREEYYFVSYFSEKEIEWKKI